jgi:hypothetical protein
MGIALIAMQFSGQILNGGPPKHLGSRTDISSDEAGKIVLRRLLKDKVYPQIPGKCLVSEIEEETKGYFLFAVRFNPECTGVQSDSTLLDRFAVMKPSHEIVWWDVAAPESFRPYSDFRHRIPDSICSLHHVRMSRSNTPILYGKPRTSDEFSLGKMEAFPNARERVVFGGCEPMAKKQVLTLACPKCDEARAIWLRAHHVIDARI